MPQEFLHDTPSDNYQWLVIEDRADGSRRQWICSTHYDIPSHAGKLYLDTHDLPPGDIILKIYALEEPSVFEGTLEYNLTLRRENP